MGKTSGFTPWYDKTDLHPKYNLLTIFSRAIEYALCDPRPADTGRTGITKDNTKEHKGKNIIRLTFSTPSALLIFTKSF